MKEKKDPHLRHMLVKLLNVKQKLYKHPDRKNTLCTHTHTHTIKFASNFSSAILNARRQGRNL